MAVKEVIGTNNEKISEVELQDSIYDVEPRSSVVCDIVRMQLARRRRNTASAKGRSDVHGSGRKPFKQKGTGRARLGDVKSPLLKGGGVIFGPTRRNYNLRYPKKVRRLALKMVLTSKLQQNELVILKSFEMEAVKTQDFLKKIKPYGINSALIVTKERDKILELSSRNLSKFQVISVQGLNVYDILRYDYLVLLESSLEAIEGRLST